MSDSLVAPRRNDSLTIEPAPQPERPSPVLDRLHALVRKGYVPELGGDGDSDCIVLRHRARAPDLVLHSDGVVEGLGARLPFYKRDITPPEAIGTGGTDEQLRFMRLLDTVPRATFRDRTRRWRHQYLYLPAVLFAVWLGCILLTGLIFSF